MKSWHLRTPTSNETNITTLFFIFPINTSIRANSFCCLWDCVVGRNICCSQIRPHTELGCSQEEQYTTKAAVIRRLCYSCKFSILFSRKTIRLRTSCMDWNDYFYNKTHTTALSQLLIFFFFSFLLSHRLCWARCLRQCLMLRAETGRRWGAQYEACPPPEDDS